MNQRLKNIYKEYLIKYIQKTDPEIKEKDLIPCPKNCSKEPTTQSFHNKTTCYNPECKYTGDIFDYIKLTKPSWKDKSDDDIADYLQHLLKVEILDDTDELLERYSKAGFCLIPIAQGNSEANFNKMPPKGFKWRDKLYKDPKIWKDWVDRGWGLALVLGKDSNTVAIDIDHVDTLEKVKHLLGDTLIQDTSRGFHYIYNFDPEIKKTMNKVLRQEGYEMEYRTNGAYIVIAPSTTRGELRKWNTKKITAMPKVLKDFLLKYYKEDYKEISPDAEIQNAITNNDLSSTKLKGLDGCCNDTFVKLGGIFRKKMNSEQVNYALSHFNNLLENPLPKKELYALCSQINKYNHYDKDELAKTVLQRIDIIKEGTAFQIASSIRHETKDVEDVLKYLEDQGKIYNIGNRKYQRINQIEWTTETNDLGVPIDFKIPYFSKYARFDYGNMIIIGGTSGQGKTHITGNLVKGLVEQGINPYVLNTETGSKIGKITDTLKVPKHSYFVPKNIPQQATDVELQDNAVTILDWLSPKDGNFAEMGNTLAYFHNQLKKHKGLLIVLMQLRTSNNDWYAKDLVFWYGALVAKYLFGDNGNDSQNTYFKTEKIRDSRTNHQYIDIPMYFDPNTKVLSER